MWSKLSGTTITPHIDFSWTGVPLNFFNHKIDTCYPYLQIIYKKNFDFTARISENIKLLNYSTNVLHISERFPSILGKPAITCSKLTIETLEQGVKYVQS